MIEVSHLRFSYGDKNIFDGLSLRFGDVTCVTGPSGCGKTTLLKLLAGLMKPLGGKIVGMPSRISFMFQEGGKGRRLAQAGRAGSVRVRLPREPVRRTAAARRARAGAGVRGRRADPRRAVQRLRPRADAPDDGAHPVAKRAGHRVRPFPGGNGAFGRGRRTARRVN